MICLRYINIKHDVIMTAYSGKVLCCDYNDVVPILDSRVELLYSTIYVSMVCEDATSWFPLVRPLYASSDSVILVPHIFAICREGLDMRIGNIHRNQQ